MQQLESCIYIAKRFAGSKHHQAFTKATQYIAIASIAVGVAILILISSIFNGVEEHISAKMQQHSEHIRAIGLNTQTDWRKFIHHLKQQPSVLNAQAVQSSYAVLAHSEQLSPILLKGLDSSSIAKIATAKKITHTGDKKEQIANSVAAYISQAFARQHYLEPYDTFSVLTAKKSGQRVSTKAVRLHVAGIFDESLEPRPIETIKLNLADINKHLQLDPHNIEYISIQTNSIVNSKQIAKKLSRQFAAWQFYDWSYGMQTLFESLALQKRLMLMVLSLVTLMGGFNLLTGLVIIVLERKKQIAILITLGLRPQDIQAIFALQSLFITSVALLLGTTAGLILSNHINTVMLWIESLLQIKLMSTQVFMLDFLPTTVRWQDISSIIISTLVLGLISAIYPARQAAKIKPAAVLRYE